MRSATLHPNEAWVVAQAESFAKQAREQYLPVAIVQHDRDTKFAGSFIQRLKSNRVKNLPGAFRSPNMNAFVERFIQSIQQECLDRFVVFGERRLDNLCAEFLAYNHDERPHQSLENESLTKHKRRGRPTTKPGRLKDEIVPLTEIRCCHAAR